MKIKNSRKNRFNKFKIGSGPEYSTIPDIENQLDNVRYENLPDIENQLVSYKKEDKENKESKQSNENKEDKLNDLSPDIDKPKNVVEYVPLQKETIIEPVEEDIEINIPSDEMIDLGNSGYGIYDKQFYGGITKKIRRNNKTKKKKNKSKTRKNKNKNK